MKTIRAFVAHSFTDDDADVIGKFLKFLDQLSELHPSFSWQHAEPAEPKILADKVMTLMTDKNLFIGICTKKEHVVLPDALKPTILPSGHLKLRKDALHWKTSDWIIQEIGVARARDLDLLLLVEEGVRQPGGLQGNLEYIQFSRTTPEKSFGKIVEMVTALSPRAIAASSVEPESMSAPAEEDTDSKPPVGDNWTKPKPEWKRRDYEFAVMHMIAIDDAEGAKKITEAYSATELASHAGNREGWEAHTEYARLLFAKGGSLSRLKQLARENAHNSLVIVRLARAYEHYHQYDDAAKAFEDAAREAKDDSYG